jgi:hypothetical protein
MMAARVVLVSMIAILMIALYAAAHKSASRFLFRECIDCLATPF